jgi:uncharacterized membrane protein
MNTIKHFWHLHPHIRSELTLGERAADRMRNGMGSWAFVFFACAFLGAWMAFNGHHGFDPFPFILLNLILSCVAALQGAILLIAAKRQDQISSELAVHDYQVNTASLQFQIYMAEAIIQLCTANNVQLPDNIVNALKHPGSIPVPLKINPPLEQQ